MQTVRKYKDSRDFFSSLRWEYQDTIPSLPVFHLNEINTEPLKWLKYLLLERVKATTVKELESTIRRYKMSQKERIIKDCENLIVNSSNPPMVILKVVFHERAGQLPNFRMYKREEIVPSIEQAYNTYEKFAQEFWLCYSTVSLHSSDLGGRITFQGSKFSPSLIEIVWFASPRLIESYNAVEFDYPFLRAKKNPGQIQFEVEELYIPKKFDHPQEKYLADFQLVLYEIFTKKESLRSLEQILFGAGAKELSIEFKISNGKFSIIDWDTEIETSL